MTQGLSQNEKFGTIVSNRYRDNILEFLNKLGGQFGTVIAAKYGSHLRRTFRGG